MKKTLKHLFYVKLPHVIGSVSNPRYRVMRLFTYEGILITLINNLVGSHNNLYATRLGAGDYELGLATMLPQLVGMAVLIPGGILTDSLKSKRDMVTSALLAVACVYVLIGFVPVLGSYSLGAFLALLAISSAPMTLYNISWQAYFSDVVHPNGRNSVLAVRSSLSFLMGITITLTGGALLSSASSNAEKIRLHQMFLWVAAFLLIVQIIVLRRIPSKTVEQNSRFSLSELKKAFVDLIHNRRFLGFIGVAIFFYMTWHIDWTLYFIGQTQYLGMDEAWLSYVNIGGAIVQFLTMGIWSKINSKHGVRFAIIFGSLGLAFCPIGMIIATSLNTANAKIIFLIMNTLFHITLATTTLNILQCLLQVIPEKNKTLNISIYTTLVMLSNGVMPLVGVSMYRMLGANLKALQLVFAIIFVLRLVATGLWALRWWKLRTES
ncbi:MAG: MFS transporter [Clostridiales bacterium]|nr:MFS transporter [Clostridiales bacterium]